MSTNATAPGVPASARALRKRGHGTLIDCGRAQTGFELGNWPFRGEWIGRRSVSHAKREFCCKPDAETLAEELLQKRWRFHEVKVLVKTDFKSGKKPRGRPKKGVEGKPPPKQKFFQVALSWTRDEERFAEILRRECVFILCTLPGTERQAAELLAAYKDQQGIEGLFRWTKGPAAVAPIFLETEHRIAALGLVYVIALMVNALIQRRIRARLQEAKATIPGNKGRSSQPTSQVLFRLMEGLQSLIVAKPDGEPMTVLLGMTTEQQRALELLGVDLVNREDVVAAASPPKRGQRGYQPTGDPAPRFRLVRRIPASLKPGGRREKNQGAA